LTIGQLVIENQFVRAEKNDENIKTSPSSEKKIGTNGLQSLQSSTNNDAFNQ